MRPKLKLGVRIAVSLIVLPSLVWAQSVSMERLSDWKFRFYACKNVMIHGALMLKFMKEKDITDQDGLDMMQAILGPKIAQQVAEGESAVEFSEDEAMLVSDLTFAVLAGLLAGDYELSPVPLIILGDDLCVSGINDLIPE